MPQIACETSNKYSAHLNTYFTSLLGTETVFCLSSQSGHSLSWALLAGPIPAAERPSLLSLSRIHLLRVCCSSFQTSLCQFCLVLNSNWNKNAERKTFDFYKNETKCSRMAVPKIVVLSEEPGEVKTSFIRKLRCEKLFHSHFSEAMWSMMNVCLCSFLKFPR